MACVIPTNSKIGYIAEHLNSTSDGGQSSEQYTAEEVAQTINYIASISSNPKLLYSTIGENKECAAILANMGIFKYPIDYSTPYYYEETTGNVYKESKENKDLKIIYLPSQINELGYRVIVKDSDLKTSKGNDDYLFKLQENLIGIICTEEVHKIAEANSNKSIHPKLIELLGGNDDGKDQAKVKVLSKHEKDFFSVFKKASISKILSYVGEIDTDTVATLLPEFVADSRFTPEMIEDLTANIIDAFYTVLEKYDVKDFKKFFTESTPEQLAEFWKKVFNIFSDYTQSDILDNYPGQDGLTFWNSITWNYTLLQIKAVADLRKMGIPIPVKTNNIGVMYDIEDEVDINLETTGEKDFDQDRDSISIEDSLGYDCRIKWKLSNIEDPLSETNIFGVKKKIPYSQVVETLRSILRNKTTYASQKRALQEFIETGSAYNRQSLAIAEAVKEMFYDMELMDGWEDYKLQTLFVVSFAKYHQEYLEGTYSGNMVILNKATASPDKIAEDLRRNTNNNKYYKLFQEFIISEAENSIDTTTQTNWKNVNANLQNFIGEAITSYIDNTFKSTTPFSNSIHNFLIKELQDTESNGFSILKHQLAEIGSLRLSPEEFEGEVRRVVANAVVQVASVRHIASATYVNHLNSKGVNAKLSSEVQVGYAAQLSVKLEEIIKSSKSIEEARRNMAEFIQTEWEGSGLTKTYTDDSGKLSEEFPVVFIFPLFNEFVQKINKATSYAELYEYTRFLGNSGGNIFENLNPAEHFRAVVSNMLFAENKQIDNTPIVRMPTFILGDSGHQQFYTAPLILKEASLNEKFKELRTAAQSVKEQIDMLNDALGTKYTHVKFNSDVHKKLGLDKDTLKANVKNFEARIAKDPVLQTKVHEYVEALNAKNPDSTTHLDDDTFIKILAYNYSYYMVSHAMMHTLSPGFCKSMEEFQKRFKEIVATGDSLNLEARYQVYDHKGNPVLDKQGNPTYAYFGIPIEDNGKITEIKDAETSIEITEVDESYFDFQPEFGAALVKQYAKEEITFTDALKLTNDYITARKGENEDTLTEAEQAIKAIIGEDNFTEIFNKYNKMSASDGQSYRSFESYFRIMGMRGFDTPELAIFKAKLDMYRSLTDKDSEEAKTLLAELRDSSVILQPIKPYKYTLETVKIGDNVYSVPYQYKCAEVVIIPELMPKGSGLRALGEYMRDKHIDVAVGTSGVKKGAFGHVDIHACKNAKAVKDALDGAFRHETRLSDYHIQNNTIYHVNQRRSLGVQARKIVTAGMDPSATYDYILQGKSTTKGGKDNKVLTAKSVSSDHDYNMSTKRGIIGLYNELIMTSIGKALETTLADLNDPNITSKKIIDSLIANGKFSWDDLFQFCLNTDYGDSGTPQFLLPLYDAFTSEQAAEIFISRFRANVVSILSAGGSAVQQSPWGTKTFDSSGDLKVVIDENTGNIEYMECEVTWDFKDEKGNPLSYSAYVNDDGTLRVDKDTDEILLDRDYPGIRDIIAYRVPSERAYSVMALKAVRFTPRVLGGTIKVPALGVVMAGFDFDIDKLYISRRNITRKKYDFTKSPIENGKKQRDNLLFDIMWARLTDKETMEARTNPGGFGHASKAAKYVRAMKLAKHPKDVLNEINEELRNEGKPEIESLSWEAFKNYVDEKNINVYPDYNLSDIEALLRYNEQNQIAGKLIGIAANANAWYHLVHGFDQVNYSIANTLDNAVLIQDLRNIGIDIDANNNVDLIKDWHKKSLIIAQILAASVDAVKDPVLNYLNLNQNTINTVIGLACIGLDFETIGLLLNSKPGLQYAENGRIPTIEGTAKVKEIENIEELKNLLFSAVANPELQVNDTNKTIIQLLNLGKSVGAAINSDAKLTKMSSSNTVTSSISNYYALEAGYQEFGKLNFGLTYYMDGSKVGAISSLFNDDTENNNEAEKTRHSNLKNMYLKWQTYLPSFVNNPYGYEFFLFQCYSSFIHNLDSYFKNESPVIKKLRTRVQSHPYIKKNAKTTEVDRITKSLLAYLMANQYKEMDPADLITYKVSENETLETSRSHYYTSVFLNRLPDIINDKLNGNDADKYELLKYIEIDQETGSLNIRNLYGNEAKTVDIKKLWMVLWEADKKLAEDLFYASYFKAGVHPKKNEAIKTFPKMLKVTGLELTKKNPSAKESKVVSYAQALQTLPENNSEFAIRGDLILKLLSVTPELSFINNRIYDSNSKCYVIPKAEFELSGLNPNDSGIYKKVLAKDKAEALGLYATYGDNVQANDGHPFAWANEWKCPIAKFITKDNIEVIGYISILESANSTQPNVTVNFIPTSSKNTLTPHKIPEVPITPVRDVQDLVTVVSDRTKLNNETLKTLKNSPVPVMSHSNTHPYTGESHQAILDMGNAVDIFYRYLLIEINKTAAAGETINYANIVTKVIETLDANAKSSYPKITLDLVELIKQNKDNLVSHAEFFIQVIRNIRNAIKGAGGTKLNLEELGKTWFLDTNDNVFLGKYKGASATKVPIKRAKNASGVVTDNNEIKDWEYAQYKPDLLVHVFDENGNGNHEMYIFDFKTSSHSELGSELSEKSSATYKAQLNLGWQLAKAEFDNYYQGGIYIGGILKTTTELIKNPMTKVVDRVTIQSIDKNNKEPRPILPVLPEAYLPTDYDSVNKPKVRLDNTKQLSGDLKVTRNSAVVLSVDRNHETLYVVKTNDAVLREPTNEGVQARDKILIDTLNSTIEEYEAHYKNNPNDNDIKEKLDIFKRIREIIQNKGANDSILKAIGLELKSNATFYNDLQRIQCYSANGDIHILC